MPEQDAHVRAKNFDSVTLGYTVEQAAIEASRCLMCKKPFCIKGCPVAVNIPAFIKAVTEKDMPGAVTAIKDTNLLPAVCGRVCPQEDQCEKVCVLGKKQEPVAIGRLERFVADWEAQQGEAPVPKAAAEDRQEGRRRRRRPRRAHRGGRLHQGRSRGDGLRGAAQGRRRARLRHPRVPSPQGDRAARGGLPGEARRRVQDELRRRQDPHHPPAHGGGRLRRGLHRLRRGAPLVHGHPRRESERRLLRQRVPHPQQPHEGLRLPELRHAHQEVQERGRRRRRQRRHGLGPHRPAPRRRQRLHRLPPLPRRDAGEGRGDRARRARGRAVPQPPWRR